MTKPAVLVRLTVNDGRIRVGRVELIGGRWRSINVDGEIVGTFMSQREAVRALPMMETTS
jgi:hypothetical protein